MKQCVLLLLACVCAHGAPLEPGMVGMVTGFCQNASALAAADLALTKINEDRLDGYLFSLFRLNNVNQMQHGETGIVFYLTLDVLETNCHVISKKNWKTCDNQEPQFAPRSSYGQCNTTIYINKPHKVVRLYNYNCVVKPVPATKLQTPWICNASCPTVMDKETQEIAKSVYLSIEKFNKDQAAGLFSDKVNKVHGLANHFALLNITRAFSTEEIWLNQPPAKFYLVDYTIQETTCANTTDPGQAATCPLVAWEFAHKGFCRVASTVGELDVACELFEPKSAEKTPRRPEGIVRVLPTMDLPMTWPAFSDQETRGAEKSVTLPLVPDPEIPGETEPTILPFPSAASPHCPVPQDEGWWKKVFDEDPLFSSPLNSNPCRSWSFFRCALRQESLD